MATTEKYITRPSFITEDYETLYDSLEEASRCNNKEKLLDCFSIDEWVADSSSYEYSGFVFLTQDECIGWIGEQLKWEKDVKKYHANL